ncbi:MAG: hypothetical protein NTY35_13250 [Planctomycetota bacterium]|nr:hypothetical protein [Planctomycetota bacterium]
MGRLARIGLLSVVALLPACSIGKRSLPVDPPPLADLEEPLDLRDEPRDEDARRDLPTGSFTGISVGAASDSLDALASDAGGLVVQAVVENSPGDLAGVELGDLVVEVRAGGRASNPRWPSEWRELELATSPGTRLEVVLDRAGAERTVAIVTVARARPAARENVERFREEERVGVVLRTASEVEARAAGLGPGGGAVVVGLSRASPWRAAGVRYGDLVRAIGGEAVAHPQVVLDAIRKTPADGGLELGIVRDGAQIDLQAGVSRRASELQEIDIPLLYSYSSDRGRSETSILFGLYRYESTPAAWRLRLLWFLEFSGGEADRLEVERSPGSPGADSAPSGDDAG